jgi:hypothetical protein
MALSAIAKSHHSAVEAFHKEVGDDSVEDDPYNEGSNYSVDVSDEADASEEDDTSHASNEDNDKDNKSDASENNGESSHEEQFKDAEGDISDNEE